MKRKKSLTGILVSLALVLSLLMSACGGTQTAQDDGTQTAAVAETQSVSTAADETAKETEEAAPAEAAQAASDQSEDETQSTSAQSADEAENTPADESAEPEDTASSVTTNADLSEAPEIPGLTAESVLPLSYATCFNVFYYTDGYKVIDVPNSAVYFVIPEGMDEPEGLSDDYIILREPFDSIYLAASSAMALFDAIDSVDAITMSGTSEGTWYIDAPLAALESGAMVYAGKYSEPDYETMIALDCDLAIESTMILHTPEVQEMIEDLGIPVFIDRSAYETGPLGRTEWVKLYGALMYKDDLANEFFAQQKKIIDDLEDFENTGLTVAYFSVNTDGSIVVRTNNDYIPAMIEAAGGKYIFDGMFEGVKSSTSAISMEQFYSVAHDADFLIYNATIESPLADVDALIAKNEVFSDFKAVQEGNVWQVDKKAYQSTDKMANLILDFNIMLTGGDESQLTFLEKLK